MSLYLDYNATSLVFPEVIDVMVDVYQNHPGNPDSRSHNHGFDTRRIVENSRAQLAEMLGIESDEVFFTSGATESINIAIQGLEAYGQESGKRHILSSTIEHKAVIKTLKAMEKRGFEVEWISPDSTGRIHAKEVLSRIRLDTMLVCLQHVNNETGMIQPVEELGSTLLAQDILFLVDATQSAGKLIQEVRKIPYTFLALSAHKFGGPQGVGALIMRRKNFMLPPVRPVFYGGDQEFKIRPGTIPVALIAGLGKACQIQMAQENEAKLQNEQLQHRLFKVLDEEKVRYSLNGLKKFLCGNAVNLYFPDVSSELLMIQMRESCSLSNGSACTSSSYAPSYVLSAQGLDEERISQSIRISWSVKTDADEFDIAIHELCRVIKNWQE